MGDKMTRDEAIHAVVAEVVSIQGKARAHAAGKPARVIVPIRPSSFDHRIYALDVADAIQALPFVQSAEWSWLLGDDAPSPELTASGSDLRPGFVVMLHPEAAD